MEEGRFAKAISAFYDHVVHCRDCFGKVGLRAPDLAEIACRRGRRLRQAFDRLEFPWMMEVEDRRTA